VSHEVIVKLLLGLVQILVVAHGRVRQLHEVEATLVE